jgi:biopolymer transport protein ExbB
MQLLLILQEATNVVTEGLSNANTPQEIHLVDLIIKGGWAMVPLGILSVMTVYIFFERLATYRNARKAPENLLDKVRKSVLKGDIDTAKSYCEQDGTPMAKMLKSGLSHIVTGSSLKTIEAAIENVGRLEIYRLEKNLSWVGTISGAAPMIGFLGTVTGMIKAFIAISQEEGSVSPKLLSSGIYEAMITTAAGLIVGITAYIAYNYLVRLVAEVVHYMEITSIEFIDLLQKPDSSR